ncbi:MAG: hypothetical protein IJT11_10210 [Bacteroidaceae bacterium]|nr:hypothetical protein [Bacteroidaceae bacterium]
MKRLLLICHLSFIICHFALAQQASAPTTLEGWAERLETFGKTIPQEQVFIHMDNTCYFLGDTIYYKAYVRRSDTGAPSRLSGVLYAELLNQDGYLVERQQLELQNGQMHGSFVLQDTLYGGYYELRAYTRWQLNWGLTEHPHNKVSELWFFNKRMAREYYQDYEKLYSRVFPVFDKPKEPGDFFHEMTLRPLRRLSKIDETSPKPKLQLFPEGGNLVAGVPNRVAFEATSNEGLHLEGTVKVTEGSANVVAEANIEQRGRGSFVFTPQSGKSYTVTYTGKKGTAKETLPSPDKDGVALQIINNGIGDRKVEIHKAGAAASEPLGMTVMHDGMMLDFQTVPAGASATLSLDEDKLKTGVCQVTIYNNVGRVYADRLFFCRKADFAPSTLQFSGLGKQPAEPFAPVSLAVEGGKPGATVSVSVCDATHSEYLYDDGNILTEMLLASEIRGFVETPGYFFEKDDEEHNRALDLLLMIQGWRRYDWHTMTAPGAFVLNHKPEQTPLLVGEVNPYMAGEQESQYANNYQSVSGGEDATDAVSLTGEQQMATNEDNGIKEAEDGGSVTAARAQTETTGPEVTTARDEVARFSQTDRQLKRELLVKARFAKPGAEQGIDGEMMTEKHAFSIPSPRFYEGCIFHLAASDSTKWNGKKHVWEYPSTDRNNKLNYPEFYVRLRPIFPRFVKPYDWYQCHLAAAPKGSVIAPDWVMDGSRLLDEVTVGIKRARLGKFDPTKPAYVIDAYKAFNEVCDAGFCPGIYYGYNRFVRDVSRTFIGDMNLSRDYVLEVRIDGKKEANRSAAEESRIAVGGVVDGTVPTESFNIPQSLKEKYNLLKNLGKVYIYTDYSPRREGNSLYDGEDIPIVTVDLHLIDQLESTRATSRDRRYVLPGYSAPEEFYQPDYSNKPLPSTKDYRRTLYWNPDLKLDDSGKAEFRFYGNGKQTHLSVSAEGLAGDGTLLTGKSRPEDR